MFKTLTRTLKLGLTAITILTAGGFAGTAFAQTYADDRVGFCTNNPTSTLCGSTQTARQQLANCIAHPFTATGCDRFFSSKEITVSKVRWCGRDRWTYISNHCTDTDIFARPNAANWAKKNSTISTRIVPSRYNQFLKGLAAGLDSAGLVVVAQNRMRMTDGSFNGKALGGDATDGTASFVAVNPNYNTIHAGILSGTDLGAPIKSSAGTKARWVGKIHTGGLRVKKDFVLEVTFGNNNHGLVEAFVPYNNPDSRFGNGHLRIMGRFDNTGVITGDVTARKYSTESRNSSSTHIMDHPGARAGRGNGSLIGLIGKEGAVGAVLSHGGLYLGGFVARPAEDVEGAAVYLKELCARDSSHEFCFLPDARIDTIVNNCIDNPFGTTASKYGSGGCVKTLGANRHSTETTQRITLCNNGGSEAGNSLCQYTEVIAGICAYSPFAPVCLKGNHNSAGRTSTKFTACRATGPSEPTCHGVSPELEPSDKKPNTATWADSFVTKSSPAELPSAAETGKRSQFLKGGKSDLDKTGISVQEHGALHFETAPLDDNNPLAGLIAGNPNPNSGADVGKEGVAFFWGYKGQYAFYSGILEDTDLGAPVNSVSRTTATWKGKFQSLWFTTKTDFDLEVAFGGNQVGTISARIANNGRKTSFSHFFIDGTFDNNGLITGSILAGKFTGGERANVRGTTYPGILRGLIGEEGAVGSFIAGTSPDNGNILTGNNYYSGGFIATPPSVVDHADWVAVFEPATRPATPAITQFLAGDAALIVNANPNRVVTFATATYNNRPLDRAATNNGFATNNDGSSNYAGLLSGVNLGAPLTAQTAVGVWQGYLASHTQTISNTANFILTVNFGTGSKAGTISATPSQHVIAGDFDDRGVIDGTVTRTHGNDVRAATLTGLIGSGGAIGVFHNNANQRSLVGGFVARKAP